MKEVEALRAVFLKFESTIRENIALLKTQEKCMIAGEYSVFEHLLPKQEAFDRDLKLAESERSERSNQLCEALGIPEDSPITVIVKALGEEGRELMLSVSQMVEAMREMTFLRTNLERMINFQLSYIEFLQAGMTGNEKMHTYNPIGKARTVQKTERFNGNG
jgi:hypothetical protein